MCDFEKNILQLLKEDKERLTPVFLQKDAPYMKSLEHGIKIAECKYKQCLETVHRSTDQSSFLRYLPSWSREYKDCNKR